MNFDQLVKDLRANANKLRIEGTLYTTAKLLDDAADALILMVRNSLEGDGIIEFLQNKEKNNEH